MAISSDITSKQAALSQAENKVDTLSNTVTILTGELNQANGVLTSANVILNKENQTMVKISADMEKLNGQLSKSSELVANATNELNYVTNQLWHANLQLELSNTAVNSSISSLRLATDRLLGLEKDLSTGKASQQQLGNSLKSLSSQIRNSQTALSQAQHSLSRHKSAKPKEPREPRGNDPDDKRDYQEAKAEYRRALREWEQDNEQLESSVRDIQRQVALLTQQEGQTAEEFKSATGRVTSLEASVATAKEEKARITDQLAEALKRQQAAKDQVMTLRGQVGVKEKELQLQNYDFKQIKQSHAQWVTAFNLQKNRYQEAKQNALNAQSEVNQLKNALEKQKNLTAQAKAELAKAKAELEKAKMALSDTGKTDAMVKTTTQNTKGIVENTDNLTREIASAQVIATTEEKRALEALKPAIFMPTLIKTDAAGKPEIKTSNPDTPMTVEEKIEAFSQLKTDQNKLLTILYSFGLTSPDSDYEPELTALLRTVFKDNFKFAQNYQTDLFQWVRNDRDLKQKLFFPDDAPNQLLMGDCYLMASIISTLNLNEDPDGRTGNQKLADMIQIDENGQLFVVLPENPSKRYPISFNDDAIAFSQNMLGVEVLERAFVQREFEQVIAKKYNSGDPKTQRIELLGLSQMGNVTLYPHDVPRGKDLFTLSQEELVKLAIDKYYREHPDKLEALEPHLDDMINDIDNTVNSEILDGSWPGWSLKGLLGRQYNLQESNPNSSPKELQTVLQQIKNKPDQAIAVAVTGTVSPEKQREFSKIGLVGNHVYAITYDPKHDRYMVQNPWNPNILLMSMTETELRKAFDDTFVVSTPAPEVSNRDRKGPQ